MRAKPGYISPVVIVDTVGVVVVVRAAQTRVQSGAPVVVRAAAAVQTEPPVAPPWREREISTGALSIDKVDPKTTHHFPVIN